MDEAGPARGRPGALRGRPEARSRQRLARSRVAPGRPASLLLRSRRQHDQRAGVDERKAEDGTELPDRAAPGVVRRGSAGQRRLRGRARPLARHAHALRRSGLRAGAGGGGRGVGRPPRPGGAAGRRLRRRHVPRRERRLRLGLGRSPGRGLRAPYPARAGRDPGRRAPERDGLLEGRAPPLRGLREHQRGLGGRPVVRKGRRADPRLPASRRSARLNPQRPRSVSRRQDALGASSPPAGTRPGSPSTAPARTFSC
jgi:hypothetical protein